jgi:ATP-binding cassette subfamily B multidrug efflux pump
VLSEHATGLGAAVLLIALVRPLSIWAHEVLSNQLVVPQSTSQIRWRAHLYTLGHALSYFQGDFSGRLANRVVQVGPAVRELAVVFIDTLLYVAIYAVTAVGLFGSISPWLVLPVLLWIAGYAALTTWFVPRARARSHRTADTRSVLIGRIVDSYTNILTVKLFARDREERAAVRDAVDIHTGAYLHQFRLVTLTTSLLGLLNSTLLLATGAACLILWRDGGMTTGEASAGLALVLRLIAMSGWVMQTVRGVFENVGVIQESMQTMARPHALVDPVREYRLPLWTGRRHGHRGFLADDPPGRESRVGRRQRGRQVHPRGVAPAPLRRRERTHPRRQSGYRRRHAAIPARGHRDGQPGHLAAPPIDPRQHRLRPAGR